MSEIVNARASNGLTALHSCAGNLGRHDHLALLLETGADISVRTGTGHSVHDIACQTRDILKEILGTDDGADSNKDAEDIAKISDLCDAIIIPNTTMKILGVSGVTLGGFEDPESLAEEQSTYYEGREDDPDLDVSIGNIQKNEASFDLAEELQRWHASITRLEEYGAKRCCSDPFPTELLSLTPSDLLSQNSQNKRAYDPSLRTIVSSRRFYDGLENEFTPSGFDLLLLARAL